VVTERPDRGELSDAYVKPGKLVVGLNKVADQRLKTFSLGMAQRLGIASALLGDPGTLVLDEPVNGLDAEGIRWIRTLRIRPGMIQSSFMASGRLYSPNIHICGWRRQFGLSGRLYSPNIHICGWRRQFGLSGRLS
jgi:hypothetical protein